MRIAIFHENFAQRGGSERVTEALLALLPQADLLSTFTADELLTPYLRKASPKNTWMQVLPEKAKLFRHYFLLYPFAIESVNLSSYDLVITSCYGYAKGVKRRQGAVHVCYCHNPMRWVGEFPKYIAQSGLNRWQRSFLSALIGALGRWEIRAARRPDFFIANSTVVAKRLFDSFGITATVIHPPVDTKRFAPADAVEDYYLILSRLISHKRLDIVVEACSKTGRRLIVIGEGPDRPRLERMAGPTVSFVGYVPDDAVALYAARCRAMVLPGEEDFGITTLEVNAAGRPVIAFKAGGALENITENLNGVFFDKQTAASIVEAMESLEARDWNPGKIREHAENWDITVFHNRIRAFLRTHGPSAPEATPLSC